MSPEQKKIKELETHVENLYEMVVTLCKLSNIRPDLRSAVNKQACEFQKIRIGATE